MNYQSMRKSLYAALTAATLTGCLAPLHGGFGTEGPAMHNTKQDNGARVILEAGEDYRAGEHSRSQNTILRIMLPREKDEPQRQFWFYHNAEGTVERIVLQHEGREDYLIPSDSQNYRQALAVHDAYMRSILSGDRVAIHAMGGNPDPVAVDAPSTDGLRTLEELTEQ